MSEGLAVSVIIVSYNTRDLLRECLATIGSVHQIIVVDNASHDGSADMVESEFPSVNLVRSSKNVGFGTANNLGLDLMSGDLALFLNSDARPVGEAITALSRLFDDSEIVAAGGRLEFEDGREQLSACSTLTLWAVFCEQLALEKIFPRSRLFSPYWLNSRMSGQDAHDVAQVMGACLMMRPVERFDERFFLYCEDTELCARLIKHGRIQYYRRARFVHHLGASSAANRWMSVARYNRGKELYFAIHQGTAASVVCWLLNRLGALLRVLLFGLLGVAASRFRDKAILFGRVLFAPLAGPSRPDRYLT